MYLHIKAEQKKSQHSNGTSVITAIANRPIVLTVRPYFDKCLRRRSLPGFPFYCLPSHNEGHGIVSVGADTMESTFTKSFALHRRLPCTLTALRVTARLRERLSLPRMLFTGYLGLREIPEELHVSLTYVSMKPLFNMISLLAHRMS
jgi:hypothetical protein